VADQETTFAPVPTPTAGVDPRVALATALQAAPGTYAVLVGSGLSSAAGVPTGWQVVQDLVRKIARAEGVDEDTLGDTPETWWMKTRGAEPRYDELLSALASTDAQRRAILRTYFDPPASAGGPFQPTAGHRALAALCAAGRIRVLLTTNFDPLLEHALDAAGVGAQVIATASDRAGMTPLPHASATVVKLHGDYTAPMLNTAEELAKYPQKLRALVARIVDEYGLLVVGWSAEYDRALAEVIAACPSRRYPTFWTSYRGSLSEPARRLIALRQATVIDTDGADEFFMDIVERIARLDATGMVVRAAAPAESGGLRGAGHRRRLRPDRTARARAGTWGTARSSHHAGAWHPVLFVGAKDWRRRQPGAASARAIP
jgi:hypothetical protein